MVEVTQEFLQCGSLRLTQIMIYLPSSFAKSSPSFLATVVSFRVMENGSLSRIAYIVCVREKQAID